MPGLFTHSRPCVSKLSSLPRIRTINSALHPKFVRSLESSENRFHIYLSQSRNPYLNLSIEHYLYEKSHPDSTILLLYINNPCVVIGRNQVPWLEANIKALTKKNIPLIRRRSGGGTVFHDHGNVNFSVIYPPRDFYRDKYAELITKALRHWQARARINERHDIVIDQGEKLKAELQPELDDMHKSGYDPATPKKCSGSAYKLSRNRALHHGTCLIDSLNLSSISGLLRSPLEPFVKARGVDSVRSPVTNAFESGHKDAVASFVARVLQTFSEAHGLKVPDLALNPNIKAETHLTQDTSSPAAITMIGSLGSDLQQVEHINQGMIELGTKEWLWGQTPKFTFSSYATEEDNRERPQLPGDIPTNSRIYFSTRSGKVLEANITLGLETIVDSQPLIQQEIQSFSTWGDVLLHNPADSNPKSHDQGAGVANWLDHLFGKTND